MLIRNKRSMAKGILMTVLFVSVLVLMFLPLFNEENAFRSADKLFNTISKGSTYYIPLIKETTAPHRNGRLEGTLTITEKHHPEEIQKILEVAGGTATREENGLRVAIGLDRIFDAAIQDSDDMFHNRGETVSGRYDLPEKRVLFAWWNGLRAAVKQLESERRFKEAAAVGELLDRGIAVGYNYYTVTPEKASDRWLILTGSLVFYVIYTLWWGFAIFFLFEGLGLQLTAGKKKEV